MLDAIKKTKYENITQLLNTLMSNDIKFKVDPETKQDLYILNEKKLRNQSEHYTIEKDQDGLYRLVELKD